MAALASSRRTAALRPCFRVGFVRLQRPANKKRLGLIMKFAGLILTASLISGCALFDGGERTAAVEARPAAAGLAARPATREAFQPAYATGRPIGLVPCRSGLVLTDDCRSPNDRHQNSGERSPDGAEADLAAGSVIPVAE